MAQTKDKNSVEKKMQLIYQLQEIDSQIDRIRILRGELPMQVQDLETEVDGLLSSITETKGNIEQLETDISDKKNEIKEAEALMTKYDSQQQSVRNNREFDAINKEIEYQALEIQLCKKRIREFTVKLHEKKDALIKIEEKAAGKQEDLALKAKELEEIVSETQKDEETLAKKALKIEPKIDETLLASYKSIRDNMKNRTAVVRVDRHACGGCFNKIPPQRQLDIATRKAITVCEYCGRILVDAQMGEK